jgi:GNAT superfamily N-acetyltransferase
VEGTARAAGPGDAARIRELEEAARVELGPMRGGHLFLLREGSLLREAATAGDGTVWVGTIDDEVVGYSAAHVEVVGDGTRLAVVDAIFVEEGARGVGVGEAMMDEVLRWSGQQGCVGVDAAALPGHRSTKNFFEGSGFTARLLIMHRALREGEGGG